MFQERRETMSNVHHYLNFFDQIPDLNNQIVKVAEFTPRCPDPVFKIKYEGAYEALGAILIVSIIIHTREQYLRYEFHEKVAEEAYRNNYQGKWKQVQELLELENMNFNSYFNWFLENFSKEDIYGNIVPLINRIIKTIKVTNRKFRKPRVRYPEYRRGYRDKGTLRFPHEIHSDWTFSGENPYREDRRNSISSPRKQIFWKNESKGDGS
jgi:hypothetical protein